MKLAITLCLLTLAFGLACLNYTEHGGWEHHTNMARENGIPAPSYALFLTGVALTVIGGIAFGVTLGRRQRARSAKGG